MRQLLTFSPDILQGTVGQWESPLAATWFSGSGWLCPCALSHLVLIWLVSRLPGYLIFKLVIHPSSCPDVCSFLHLGVRQQDGDRSLCSGLGSRIKRFHVWRQCLTCPIGHGLLQLCRDTERMYQQTYQVPKTHFQNVKWPLMTSRLINSSDPGVLGGERLRAKFSV